MCRLDAVARHASTLVIKITEPVLGENIAGIGRLLIQACRLALIPDDAVTGLVEFGQLDHRGHVPCLGAGAEPVGRGEVVLRL
jgi:hypothetical protein